ncbi:MAG: outer membrane beta-barrel protein [Litorimonas sp.]
MTRPAKYIAALALSLAAPHAAFAQDMGVYAGVGIDAVEFDTYAVSGKLGYTFGGLFGIEAQGGLGISDEDFTALGDIIAEAGVDNYLAGFLVGRVPLSDGIDLVGRVGYHTTDIDATIGGVDVSRSEDGIAAGAGIEFGFGPSRLNAVRAEYTFLDADTDDLSGVGDLWTLSIIRKF